jgi:hypothetical protein
MTRSARIVSLGAVVAVLTLALAYYCSMKVCARHMAGTDDLAWLRHEFQLNDADMVRIRQLHEGYLPQCREYCARIASKRSELDEALLKEAGQTADLDQKLVELGTLRAQCQANMLKHFEEVSRAMPAEQGKRYLAEMRRLTIGSHERFENSMGSSHSSHGAH